MHAVLTGDIVGSSGLSPEEHREVVAMVKSVAHVFPDAVVGKVDVLSGDSWQMLVSDCIVSAGEFLRFGEAKDDQQLAEYILIGTLLSFGLAIAVAALTKAVVGMI